MLRRMNEEIDKIKAAAEREKFELLAKLAPPQKVDSPKDINHELNSNEKPHASDIDSATN